MTDLDLNDSVHMALLKIHVITGWVVPQAEFMDVLIDQMTKYLKERYPLVNLEELEYAFRTYGTTVKDWGKQLNLSLIDEVLVPYLEARREISDKEQQKSTKMIEAPKESLSDQSMNEWVEELKKEKRVDFMPLAVYEWLDKKGRINYTKMQKFQALQVAATHRRQQLIDEDSKELSEFMYMWTTGQFEGKILDHLKNLAKKFLLMDFLNEAK